MDAPFQNYKFSNGLRLLAIETKGQVASMQWIIKVGEDAEMSAHNLQLAHLIEHLVSLLTSSKFPNGKQNLSLLGEYGIEMNAHTFPKYTNVIFDCLKSYINICVDLVLNTILDFQLDFDMIEQEKRAIMEELKSRLNDPWIKLDEKVNKIIYPAGYSRAVPMIDQLKNVKNLTTEQIFEWLKQYYIPSNMTLIIACQNVADVVGYMKNSFANYFSVQLIRTNTINRYIDQAKEEGNHTNGKYFTNETAITKDNTMTNLKSYLKNIRYVHIDNVSQDRIILCFPLPFGQFSLKNICAAECVVYILSDSLKSRFDHILREQLGLIYSQHISLDLETTLENNNLSTLTIETSTDSKNTKRVIMTILEILQDLKQYGMTKDEWYNDCHRWFYFNFATEELNLLPSRYVYDYLESFTFLNSIQINNEKLKTFERLTLSYINEKINQWFNFDKMAIFVGTNF